VSLNDWHPDPDRHHPYCQFYRERNDCTCFEGRQIVTETKMVDRRRLTAEIKKHVPSLYPADPHGSQIHCRCGIAFHMAGWWAHLTVEVIELGTDA
jgi:hypothetical protein